MGELREYQIEVHDGPAGTRGFIRDGRLTFNHLQHVYWAVLVNAAGVEVYEGPPRLERAGALKEAYDEAALRHWLIERRDDPGYRDIIERGVWHAPDPHR